MSAFELLKHGVFDRIRDKEKEMVLKRLRSSNNDITLKVDRDDAFDYENKWEKYQIPDLKRMLAQEIKDFHRSKMYKWKNIKIIRVA